MYLIIDNYLRNKKKLGVSITGWLFYYQTEIINIETFINWLENRHESVPL